MIHERFAKKIEDWNNSQEMLENWQNEECEKEQWREYSLKEIEALLDIPSDEASMLVNSDLFRTYRSGQAYRISKKSVDERMKTLEAVASYRNKKSMAVSDMKRLLGLGKTEAYRLVNQCHFQSYILLGKIRIDVASFEDWYAGQFRHKKVTGERPGLKYGYTLAPSTIGKVLGIPQSTANDLMNRGQVKFIRVNGTRRILQESFEKWYASQERYKMVKTIEEVEGYVDRCTSGEIE